MDNSFKLGQCVKVDDVKFIVVAKSHQRIVLEPLESAWQITEPEQEPATTKAAEVFGNG